MDFNDPVFTNIAKTKIVSLTGFQNIASNSELFIYPNPTSNEINLEISNTQGKNIAIDLYNLYGQKVKSLLQGNINTIELKRRFEIGDLQQGMYLLEYRLDGISRSKRLLNCKTICENKKASENFRRFFIYLNFYFTPYSESNQAKEAIAAAPNSSSRLLILSNVSVAA
ncbi:MAG: T9SS type A sorting domain-containing protein [Bacteroidetes bacterium]|nr:T9SS type A sorting domain-containing protein [Bacteroidota bacterium]